MADNTKRGPETPPIHTDDITFGELQSEIMPFENSRFDFAAINNYLRKNPAVQTHIIPDAIVSSCSKCCMAEINGKPNILGALFRKSRAGKGCSQCPVSIASEKLPARMADGQYLRDRNGKIVSEAGAVRIAEDGTA